MPVLFSRAGESFYLIQITGNCFGRHVWNTSTPVLHIIRRALWSALLSAFSVAVAVLGGPRDPRALDVPFADVNESGG